MLALLKERPYWHGKKSLPKFKSADGTRRNRLYEKIIKCPTLRTSTSVGKSMPVSNGRNRAIKNKKENVKKPNITIKKGEKRIKTN